MGERERPSHTNYCLRAWGLVTCSSPDDADVVLGTRLISQGNCIGKGWLIVDIAE